jgi:hypothetical protein
VQMIRHIINSEHFVLIILHYTGDIFMQLVLPFGLNKRLTKFNGHYTLDVNLGIGVCHKDLFMLNYHIRN